jgi:hypothetical protein
MFKKIVLLLLILSSLHGFFSYQTKTVNSSNDTVYYLDFEDSGDPEFIKRHG